MDAAVARAQKAGATIHLAGTDIPNIGRFAVVQDPQGAVLNPFTPAMDGTAPAGPPPNYTFCWDECLTTDPEAAAEFYAAVYHWTSQASEMGELGKYYVLHRAGGEMSGGIMKLPMPGVPPHWLSHVAVDNLEASIARAESLGGRMLSPPTQVPNFGRFAVLSDPSGAVFSIFQGAQQ